MANLVFFWFTDTHCAFVSLTFRALRFWGVHFIDC